MSKVFSCLFGLLFSIYAVASEPLKIGIISDLHLLANDLHDGGYKAQEIVGTTGKNIIASGNVIHNTITLLDSAKIDVLLISGDLTYDGEKTSHLQLKEELNRLTVKGTRIFIIPGNHDIENPEAKGFKGNNIVPAETVSVSEFLNIYQDFGYNTAISRDDESLSYISPLDKDTYLLAIDATNTQNRANGILSQNTIDWLSSSLDEARNNNKRVIAMMHWGLLEHIPFQKKYFPTYLVQNAEILQSLLADKDVEVIFTGHFHVNDINKYESIKQNQIYDIATGALISFPYSIRFADLYSDKLIVNTINIEKTEEFPTLAADSKQTLLRLMQSLSKSYLQKLGLNFSEQNMAVLSNVVANYFIATFAGDEKFSEADILNVQEVFSDLGFPVDEALRNFDLEENISDNHIIIPFKNVKKSFK